MAKWGEKEWKSDDQKEIIKRPDHYTRWKIEPIVFIMENGMSFWRGNIVKYVLRAGYKDYQGQDSKQSEITDLKKAARYIEMRINLLKGNNANDI